MAYSLHQLVDLVPHLGRGEVVGGRLGVLAGRPLDAGELLLRPGGVHHEAHSSGKDGLRQHGVIAAVRRPGRVVVTDSEDAEGDGGGRQQTEDEEVGEVEGQHLRRRRRPGQELHGGGNERAVVRIAANQARGQQDGSEKEFHPC